MTNPSVTIVGAAGEMGRYLLRPFLEKRASTIRCIDKDASEAERTEAMMSDVIILAIPQPAAADLLRGTRLRPEQLLIDICSVKHDIVDRMKATGATVLSVHPMNGPHTPWAQQKWIFVGAPDESHPLIRWFVGLLREKQVLFHVVEDAAQHDRLMSVVLGLPEMMTMVLSRYFAEPGALPLPSLRDVAKVCSPAFASLLQTYFHTVHSTPLWLREELLLRTSPEFVPVCRKVFRDLAAPEAFGQAVETLKAQTEEADGLRVPEEFFSTLRGNVTTSFEYMNAVFFDRPRTSPTALYIQKSCTAGDLRAGREKTRVGIHGIRGAFTDEAWHRFSTEVANLPESETEIAELVHSANVLRAVNAGEVDIGIFAFANSGSGGYLASIEAMGEHSYELLALFTMPINMCILTDPSVEGVHQLRRFFGHPVALSQCRKTLAQRWPDVPVEPATDEMDTALSARELAEGRIDRQTGVFASKRAAQLYGLKVLVEGVHHDPSNATAFAVVRKRSPSSR